MALEIKHATLNNGAVADDPSFPVGPDEWDEAHTLTGELEVAKGGTGAANASDARTNLGLAIGTDVQAHSAVLDATTASFTTADETKLDGIEAGADVTDAGNVGAVLNATSKNPPIDADRVYQGDSVTSFSAFYSTWTQIKAFLKTYFDTLYQPLAAALTSWAGVTRASGFDTFAATPSSANLASLVTDETGSGALVFGTSPTFTTSVTLPATVNLPSACQFSWNSGNVTLTHSAGLLTLGSTTVDIDNNSGAGPSGVGTPTLRLIAADSVQSRINFESYGNSGQFASIRANGTGASPSQLLTDNPIFEISGFGYHSGNAFSASRVALRFMAAEDWTSSANGTYMRLMTTASGATTLTEQLRIANDGALVHRNNATTVVNASSHLGLRSYTVGTLPTATAQFLIYVSDGTSNKRLAVADGSNWRFPDGNVVS